MGDWAALEKLANSWPTGLFQYFVFFHMHKILIRVGRNTECKSLECMHRNSDFKNAVVCKVEMFLELLFGSSTCCIWRWFRPTYFAEFSHSMLGVQLDRGTKGQTVNLISSMLGKLGRAKFDARPNLPPVKWPSDISPWSRWQVSIAATTEHFS